MFPVYCWLLRNLMIVATKWIAPPHPHPLAAGTLEKPQISWSNLKHRWTMEQIMWFFIVHILCTPDIKQNFFHDRLVDDWMTANDIKWANKYTKTNSSYIIAYDTVYHTVRTTMYIYIYISLSYYMLSSSSIYNYYHYHCIDRWSKYIIAVYHTIART